MNADVPAYASTVNSAASSGRQLPSPDASRSYRRLANFELVMASVLLILASCFAYLTVSFFIWALRQDDVPLFGILMASSIRAGVAVAFGTVGLLLLKSARATLGVAERGDSASNKQMRDSHVILVIGGLSFTLLALVAIVLFFIALGQSNM